MKVLFLFMSLAISFKVGARSVAICSIVVKVVDHKIEPNCGKNIETHCDEVAVLGLHFPVGTTLVYSCDFKDLPRKPLNLVRAELSDKMKFE